MAIQVTTQVIDSDSTGNANEFRVVLQHDADFPTGATDPVTGLPVTVHNAVQHTVVFTATTGPQFRTACRADGNAWKAFVIATIAAQTAKIIGGVNIGEVIGPY
jgi:hypothetical protein